MPQPTSPTPTALRAPGAAVRYGAAVAAPLIALGLTWIAPALQQRATFLLFFGAVALAGWYGLGPGLLATALSVLLVDLAFVAPIGRLGPLGLDDVARLAGFVGMATFIAALSERSRVARAEAQERQREAELLAAQLQEQAIELEHQTDELQSQSADAQALAGELEQSNELLAETGRRIDAERARVAQVLDGLDAAVISVDRDLRVLHVNLAAAELLAGAGRDAVAAIGQRLGELAPGMDRPALVADVERALALGRPAELEQHDPLLDRWRHVRVIPVDSGAILVARDVTAERRASSRVEESEARYRALVEASSNMVFTADVHGLVDDVPGWRALTGQTRDEVRGEGWTESLHLEDRASVAHGWREAVTSAHPFEAEFRVRIAGGGHRWYQARAMPMRDDRGRVREWVGTFTDVHERRRAESALALLAGAGRLLESPLDVASTLQSVARLTVPGHADYCVVHVLGEDGASASHAVAHVEATGEAALRELADRAPADPEGDLGWTAAIRTGRPQHFPSVDGPPEGYARDPRHRRLLDAVGTRSAMVLPLTARERVLGAMTLGAADPDRRFDERDLAVAEQLARRVALALDSARLFAAERAARAAAESASRTKSEFLATMSHELRTPLNAILGYTSLILEEISGAVTDGQRAQLHRVRGSARHLLALIEEILSLSRLDAGRESTAIARVDLGALARDTAAMVEPSISMKGLGFLVDVPAAPAWALTDPVKVRQVLLNLLSNAAKFTERGEVRFSMRARADHASFEVRDTGIGVAREHQERIFDAFWQVEQSATRRIGGTGLGLHVARRLARLLGGDVAVTSVPGKGSAFTFWIATQGEPRPSAGLRPAALGASSD